MHTQGAQIWVGGWAPSGPLILTTTGLLRHECRLVVLSMFVSLFFFVRDRDVLFFVLDPAEYVKNVDRFPLEYSRRIAFWNVEQRINFGELTSQFLHVEKCAFPAKFWTVKVCFPLVSPGQKLRLSTQLLTG